MPPLEQAAFDALLAAAKAPGKTLCAQFILMAGAQAGPGEAPSACACLGTALHMCSGAGGLVVLTFRQAAEPGCVPPPLPPCLQTSWLLSCPFCCPGDLCTTPALLQRQRGRWEQPAARCLWLCVFSGG